MRDRKLVAFVLMLSLLLTIWPNSTAAHATESGVESFSFKCHNMTGYLGTGKIEHEDILEEDILSYSFEPYGTSEPITMVSSNTDVATVDSNEDGTVWHIYYHALGTTEITATTASGLTDRCTVTVTTMDEVYLEQPFEVTVHPGDVKLFMFTPEEGGYYSFYTEDENALMNINYIGKPYFGSGVDTQMLDGKYPFVLAVWNGGNSVATYTVSVKEAVPVEQIIFEYDHYYGFPGDSEVIRVSLYPAWSIPEEPVFTSSDDSVVYYDPPGSRWVTFGNPGTATITATVANGVSAQCAVTVHDMEAIAAGDSKTISLSSQEEKRYTFTPEADGRYVIYMPTGDFIVTEEYEDGSASGYMTHYGFYILQNGTTLASSRSSTEYQYAVCDMTAGETYTLKVRNNQGCPAAITGTVFFDKVEDPSSFSLVDENDGSSGTVFPYQYFYIYATPADGLPFITSDIAWSVADQTVVALNYTQGDFAAFSAVGAGSTTITATLSNGVSASYEVTVQDTALTLGQVVSVEQGSYIDFTFTPETDGYYAVYVDAPEDVFVSIYSDDYSIYDYKMIPANSKDGLSLKMTGGVTCTISPYFDLSGGSLWVDEGIYVTSMEITALPEAQTYVEGFIASNLRLSGLEMSVAWSDGTVSEYAFDKSNNKIDSMTLTTEADEENGVITLRCCEAETSFSVELIENPVAAISIANEEEIPGLLENAYYLERGGYQPHVISRKVRLQVEYTDGTTEIIGVNDRVVDYPVRASASITGPDGTNTVTYSVLGQSITYNAHFVENPVESIELVSGPDPFVIGQDSQVYKDDDVLSFSSDFGCRYDGLEFRIHYTDGTSEDVNFADLTWPESDSHFYKLPEYKNYPVEAMFYIPNFGDEFGYWGGSQIADENGQIPMILHYMGSYLYFDVTIREAEVSVQTVASGWSGVTQWTLTSDGVLTVYGEGAMKNYGYNGGQPWLNKGVDIVSVVIEEGVTSVGSGAFRNLTTLKSVTFPESLTKMGEAAFYGSGLESVEIPGSLWTIQPYTFKNCANLKSVKFHEGNLQKISDGAFYGTGLTELVLPDCLDILDVYAFKGCAKLTKITIGKNLTELREAVFYGTAIPTITIPEGITKIGPYAFKNCVKLETIDLPSTLTSVGEAAFYADTALKAVELPDKVTTIGNYAFRKCAALETLKLSAELTTIGECAFYGCTSLTELVIPDKVTTIKPYAFKTCTGLTSVTLGEKVTSIGEGAFNTCTSLKTIVFPASLKTIGDYCFSGSYNIWKMTFQGDAPSIGTGAFKGLNATAYYPAGNATWTATVMQNYGGTVTWKAN